MGVLSGVIKEEQDRLESLIQLYDGRLAALPKGSIRIKGTYAYLKCREGSRTPTSYLGRLDDEKVQKVREQLKERQMYLQRRKKAMLELMEVRRALRTMAA